MRMSVRVCKSFSVSITITYIRLSNVSSANSSESYSRIAYSSGANDRITTNSGAS